MRQCGYTIGLLAVLPLRLGQGLRSLSNDEFMILTLILKATGMFLIPLVLLQFRPILLNSRKLIALFVNIVSQILFKNMFLL